MSNELQYSIRSQRSLGLLNGPPGYQNLDTFQQPEEYAKTSKYSSNGKLFAYALSKSIKIVSTLDGSLVKEIEIDGVQELNMSPRATYVSTWQRPRKYEDGSQFKNMKIWKIETAQEIASFTVKSQEDWDVDYTVDESLCARLNNDEIQVFDPSNFKKGVVSKLKVEGMTNISVSPGQNPYVAAFIAEKKGAPASLRLYSLISLTPNARPVTQKTFFKADSVQMKWNELGTAVLFQTQTDYDKTNKNYYGESNLYLMSTIGGGFDAKITLDKEGPIHDFSWSPNSKEFIVIYGFMPSKAVLFDQRGNPFFDFGTSPRNFILFNPHGRLILIAGFGNLAGQVDIWDRKSLKKIGSIEGSNTSYCEWSPDGRYILTATLSPRLRVDNGLKIWHMTGKLLHLHPIEELYQVSWKPGNVNDYPPLKNDLEVAPNASESVKQYQKPAISSKPLGAYVPPHLRGNGSSSSSGASTPNRKKQIPGAGPPVNQNQKQNNKNNNTNKTNSNGNQQPTSQNDELSPLDKKIRNLTKKLKAIDELKEKQKGGEKLERTQLLKLDSENEIKNEIQSLKNGN